MKGSFRVLKKYALRASTAAPTVFKPVLMGGEMYCDGGIVGKSGDLDLMLKSSRRFFSPLCSSFLFVLPFQQVILLQSRFMRHEPFFPTSLLSLLCLLVLVVSQN